MGLFDNLFGGKKEEKGFKPLDDQWANIFLRNNSEITSSDQKDETYIDKGFRMNPTVYSIINTVAKNAGMVKWGIYKKDVDGTKKPFTDRTLQLLLDEPNGLGTWNHLIQQAIGFKMLTGNLYLWGIKGAGEKLASIYVLPSQDVQIHANETKRAIMGYSIDTYGESNESLIPAADVLHIKDFNPEFNSGGDFLYGQSPLRAALTSLYINNDALTTSRSYLLNQGPRGVLAKKYEAEMFGEMSEEQINSLRTRFRQNHTGVKKAGELLVAPGDWSWIEIGSSAADLMLIEHYNLSVNDICNAYSFPTILLGNGETTFANLKEAKKALWSNVITPILSEIRDGLNTWLASRYGKDICLDFDLKGIAELQDDWVTQSNAIKNLQNLVTVNEARSFIGLAPIEGEEGEEIYRFVQGTESDRNDAETDNEFSGESQAGSEDSKETE